MAADLSNLLAASGRRREAAAPASPCRAPKPPLAVPGAKHLREAMDMGPDLFGVRPQELVRKAMDEVAMGMSWYVLYTMVHSSSTELRNKTIGKVTTSVRFSTSKEIRPGLNGDIVQDQGTHDYKIAADNKQSLRVSMQQYIDAFSSLDFRTLINHVVGLNANHVRTAYYNASVVAVARKIQLSARFFFHRNANTPDMEKGAEDATPEKICERDFEVASTFFGEVLPGLLDSIKSRQAQLPSGKKGYGNSKAWQLDACTEVRDAAMAHFKSARAIGRLFQSIFATQNVAPPPPSPTVQQTLDFLLDQVRSDVDRTAEIASQFTVFALWTRLGYGVRGRQGSDDPAWSTTTTVPSHLGTVTVIRHELDADERNGKFVKQHKSFLADPIGSTNLDQINRALDLSVRAIREVLLLGVKRCGEVIKEGPQTGEDYELIGLLKHISDLGNMKPLRPRPMSALPSNTARVFDEHKDKVPKLLEDFEEKHPGSTGFDLLEKFIRYSGFFADPRFVAEFLVRHKGQNGTVLFPTAKTMRHIRDHASHQFNLHNAHSIRFEVLEKAVNDLMTLIDELGSKIGVDACHVLDRNGLDELQTMLPFYNRWRGRQVAALKSFNGDKTRETAEATLVGIIAALSEDGRLPAVNVGPGKTDASTDALIHLLAFVELDVHVNAAAPPSPDAVSPVSRNPYALLFVDE